MLSYKLFEVRLMSIFLKYLVNYNLMIINIIKNVRYVCISNIILESDFVIIILCLLLVNFNININEC